MDWIEPESFGFDCPSFADEVVWGETLQGLEAAAEVVGADEVGEMALVLAVGVVVIALDGGLLDRTVHSLDLPVGPGMLWLGQPMLDAELGAGVFEAVSPDGLAFGQGFDNQGDGRSAGARRCEMCAVVRQNDVDLVGHGFDEMAQEVAGGLSLGSAMEFDIGEFA
jgi:hypothetical protein